jgi:ribosomal protein S27E
MEEPVEIRRRESIKPVSLDGLLNGALVGPFSNGTLTGHFTYHSPEEEDDTVLAVNCRVCQTEIIIDKEEGFVVKCALCNEATVN